jgi:hypothetical protein
VTDPRADYARRIARWNAEMALGAERHHRLANLRLVVAAGAGIVAVAAFRGAVSWGWLGVPLVAFVALVVVHDRVLRAAEHALRARRLYERGLARIEGRWAGAGPDGGRFLDDHPFARDLDLFGPASLFQLLDTARTEIGEDTLADWLRHGAELEEIAARQAAVAELRPMVDFREAIAVTATEVHVGRTGAMARWAVSPPAGFSAAARIMFAAFAGVSVMLTVAVFAGRVDGRVLMLWLALQSGVVLVWRRRLDAALAGIELASHDLTLLRVLLERLERQPFSSPRLSAIRDALATDGRPPSQCLARLERLVAILDSRRNFMFAPFAALLLVRSQMAMAIDRWHAVHGPAIGRWLRAVGEIEALSALATFAYEHPADPFPAMVAGEAMFDADALAHPLLSEATAVPNDVRLGGQGPHVLVVSGSNMSGKSTLLRAIGVNVVLALAGAPVRASRLRLSRLALGATLRIEDSLQEGHSKFYAEILRIHAIVGLAGSLSNGGPAPLLFLLDEILGGTNSHDRRIGAEAIVRTLVGRGAIGLITTHDLALTEVVATLGPAAANVHFQDHLEHGRLVFDYKMRPGVVERSNALALMRAVGLEV